MSEHGYDLEKVLEGIDAGVLHYDDWLAVGAALHHEGFPCSAWRAWTERDTRPDHQHRLARLEYKWGTFGENTGKPVTGGTIVRIAREQGWKPERDRPRRILDWDSTIGGHKATEAKPEPDEPAVVDASLIDDNGDVVPLYADGHETEELAAFISALFEDGERIGYVLDAAVEETDAGKVKYKPASRGVYARTAGEIKQALSGGSMENALGTFNTEAGAWIRLNPLDGKGVGNANVTEFRFALLESDEMPKAKFAEIVKQMNLPIAALVDSGNKSLHAVVRIGAADIQQYAERVNTLYARCEKNGIAVDKANKNPSRMMRLPGAYRQGRRQFLAGLSQGAGDWEEWCEWYAEATDELPDTVNLATLWGDNMPALKPALIDGVLRVGHKMILAGPSKAGKSFALMSLCMAFAEGGSWLGFKCMKSKVLYVNLELGDEECPNRFNDIANVMERRFGHAFPAADVANIDIWNLRGRGEPLAKLLVKLIRRAKRNQSKVVIIDPIYKVLTGDENNASDMAAFSNLFDELCLQAGVTAIYAHHHSKGFQGGKRSIDRASGSGVFGRDPDAILDMVELDVTDDMRWEIAQAHFVAECGNAAAYAGRTQDWDAIPENIRRVASYALENVLPLLPEGEADAIRESYATMQKNWPGLTAWRISTTLRDFANMRPMNAWFNWPLFTLDESLASCGEAGGDGTNPKPKGGGRKDGKPAKGMHSNAPAEDSEEVYREINDAIAEAVQLCADDGVEPTRKNIHKRIQEVQGKKPKYSQVCKWTESGKPWTEWVPGHYAKGSSHGEKVMVRKSKEGQLPQLP